jgi:acetyl-CoA synthetase
MSSKKSAKKKTAKKPATEEAYKPSKEFSSKARIKSMAQYKKMYNESIDAPAKFWAKEASELTWQKKWTKVLDWKVPYAKWFVGGKINVCENCVDRHANGPRKNKAAIIFEGEPGDRTVLTYAQLKREVCKFANVLEKNGVKSKDRVIIYMPMIPEAAIAMLACARIGAVHSVIFGGFSPTRSPTASTTPRPRCHHRRRRLPPRPPCPLKPAADEALAPRHRTITTCVVVQAHRPGRRPGRRAATTGGTSEMDAEASTDCTREAHDSSTRCSSSTPPAPPASPRASSTPPAATSPRSPTPPQVRVRPAPDTDVYWCTADVGWVTGHSYIVYGPLANGATQVMYEGAPNHPDFSRFWQIVEELRRDHLLHRPDRHPRVHEVG